MFVLVHSSVSLFLSPTSIHPPPPPFGISFILSFPAPLSENSRRENVCGIFYSYFIFSASRKSFGRGGLKRGMKCGLQDHRGSRRKVWSQTPSASDRIAHRAFQPRSACSSWPVFSGPLISACSNGGFQGQAWNTTTHAVSYFLCLAFT